MTGHNLVYNVNIEVSYPQTNTENLQPVYIELQTLEFLQTHTHAQ